MQINFSGQITKKEFVNAIKVHYNQQFKTIKIIFGIILIIVFFGAILVLFSKIPASGPDKISYYLPFFIFIITILTSPWWLFMTIAPAYDKKENIYNAMIHGTVDDQGITIFTKNSSAITNWAAFLTYQISEDYLLLYLGKNNFNIFTRGLFSTEADWLEFQTMVKQKLPARKA
jgi:hypothetical protein